MKSVLHGPVYQNNRLEKVYSEDYMDQDFKEEISIIDQNGIKGKSIEICLNGIILEMREVEIEDRYSVNVYHDFPLFKLHFEIEGSNHYIPKSDSTEVFIPNGHYNFFYLPHVDGELHYNTQKRKTLEISFTEAYIKRIIGNDFKNALFALGKAIDEKAPYLLWENSKPITMDLYQFIEDIKQCKFKGIIKKAYLEAKVMELLVITFAKVNEQTAPKDAAILDKANSHYLLRVEDYIKNNLDKNLTISLLATIAGINTSKLKQVFKQTYDSTIFQYITSLRMQKARLLILDAGMTVAQASQEVGYKNPQHFTVAFKKKYGLLPKDLRNI